jgi:hypothetical protein
MIDGSWVVLVKVAGEFQAELLRGLLEAQEIPVRLLQEGYARAVGLTVGPLGEVEIMVPKRKLSQAHSILAQYYRGDFEEEDLNDNN